MSRSHGDGCSATFLSRSTGEPISARRTCEADIMAVGIRITGQFMLYGVTVPTEMSGYQMIQSFLMKLAGPLHCPLTVNAKTGLPGWNGEYAKLLRCIANADGVIDGHARRSSNLSGGKLWDIERWQVCRSIEASSDGRPCP